MNALDFIISINKISLIAFIATLGFIGYELFLFSKEKRKQSRPVIPNFNEKLVIQNSPNSPNVLVNTQTEKIVKTNPIILIVLLVLLLVFGTLSIVGFLTVKNNAAKNIMITPTPLITYKRANGIKIFDQDFTVLGDSVLSRLEGNKKIIIGIDKIVEVDIDKARIRVNKDIWEQKGITDKFDTKHNMFYIEYITATNSGELKIDAQLHSKTDGWLGK